MYEAGFQVAATSGVVVDEFRVEEERPAGTDAALFVVYGEVDLHAAPELRERLSRALDGGVQHVVVDLSRVSFLDSMALSVLLGARKQLRASGGELRLVVPGAKVRNIFEITLLDQVFTLDRTRQEALGALGGTWDARSA